MPSRDLPFIHMLVASPELVRRAGKD
ncbi:hypothetical protein NOVOSPHI9U_690006 [Novosphingobium sp. 9U]|nr:hypothetical protein NOVOSPHI9U_690006 [Novosphingobium sp. 9U]